MSHHFLAQFQRSQTRKYSSYFEKQIQSPKFRSIKRWFGPYISCTCTLTLHSIELEIFIPPLMLSSFEPIVINISTYQPLACRSQFHNEGVGTKILSFQQVLRRSTGCKVEVTKLEQLKKLSSSLDLDDEMDVDPQQKYTHMYKIGKHTCEDLIFQI